MRIAQESHIDSDLARPGAGSVPALLHSIAQLTDTLDALRAAIEGAAVPVRGEPRYTCAVDTPREIVGEKEMAEKLNITRRSLAGYRRRGKLPGCWFKNGKRVQWRVGPTLEAWNRGIA